jgi:hypothetical protein
MLRKGRAGILRKGHGKWKEERSIVPTSSSERRY